jgi:hypothetical protein
LIIQYPESAFAKAAQRRADDLSNQQTKEFYDWFAKYERPRPMAKEPGIPGKKPAFSTESLGSEPILKRPTFLDLPEGDKEESESAETPDGKESGTPEPTADDTSKPADAAP